MEKLNAARFALRVSALALLCHWSCASAGTSASFDALPEPDRTAFNRCWEHMRVPTCGATSDLAEVMGCSRSSTNTYAAYATEAERRAWLATHGCPPAVVSSGGAS